MKYCENCRALCESDCCSICESTELREVKGDDYCYLTECAENFGELLNVTLTDMQIPCALMPFGNGARSALGLNLGNFRVFVPYEYYENARDVLDQLTYNPTEDFRKDLLENEARWHINGKFAQKRMRRKLRLADGQDLVSCVKQAVVSATEILDDGAITSCTEGGHYIAIKINDRKVWFNSATYEIFM